MSSRDSLAEKTGVVVFSRLITTLMDIILVIVLVRLLSSTDFVIISFLLLVYETAKYLATLGFPDSVFYFFERVAKNARAGFALQTCAILVVTAAFASLMMLLFVPFLPGFLSEWLPSSVLTTQSLLPLMAMIAFIEIPTWPVNNILLAADRQKSASWYNLMNTSLTFAAIVGPISMGYSLETAIWCLLGYSMIRLVVSVVWLWKVLPPYELGPNRKLIKEQIAFSIPIGLSALVARFNRNVDKFIVSYFLAESVVAIYIIGATEIPLVKVIPFAVGSVLISRFVQFQMDDQREELRDLWYKGIEKVSLIVLPLTFLFIALAPEIITLLFGADKIEAALPFQIYSLIILIRVTSYGSILQAFGDTRSILKLSFNLLFWNILFSVPFTLWFGIVGTASAAVLANYINIVITLRVIGRHMREPWYRVLPLRSYFKVLGVAAGVGALTWSLKSVLPHLPLSLMVGITVSFFLMAFVVIGSLTKVISANDRRQLANWLKLRFLFS
jgi:O-antigen/teichoic acid export membrane protein